MITAGHTVEADGAITAANLANDQLFIVGEGSVPTAGEITDLANWVTGGGILILFTNSNFSGGAGANAILTGLGSTMSLSSGFSSATGPLQGGNFASTGPPYNIVGQNIAVSPGNFVSGGNTLYGFGIHYEQIGSGFVYAFGDRYDHNAFSPSAANTNGQLFLNIANGAMMSSVVPEPSTFTLLGIGTFGMAFYGWRLNRKKRKMAA